METEHRVVTGDARAMDGVGDGEVELVVTSPPYPMVEMWDDAFSELNPEVGERLDDGDGDAAFELMHAELGKVWDEVARVLSPGGVACVNVGDATRKLGGSFEMYPNHVRVVERFRQNGFEVLPDVLWRKPANSAAKFMGSGMLPPNAYVTLEHEYVLVFRKGGTRDFEAGAETRYESAYFWEERNDWFSDVWTDVRGALQELEHDGVRERSGAFPLEIPYRLVNMYSVQGDTVLDPFLGTGTTTLAAMAAARNSVGYEIRPGLVSVLDERLDGIRDLSNEVNRERVERHRSFVEGRETEYESSNYGFGVVTKQEEDIRLYSVDELRRTDRAENPVYEVTHRDFR